MVDVTVLCLVRHGHATAAVCIDRLRATTRLPFRLLYVDVGSPPSIRSAIDRVVESRPGGAVVRFDDFVSRQTARLRVLERIDTELTVVLDNNMLCAPGCIDALVETSRETGAAMVSPIIVTQGGDVHFSGGFVRRRPDWKRLRPWAVHRPHHQPGVPVGAPLSGTRPRRVAIDFVESHCCLARTDCLRLPGVLEEDLHNAHTLCWAGYRLERHYGRRLLLEPSAVAAILPIGFGYDLPWMLRSYQRPDWIALSHLRLRELLGRGPGTDLGPGLRWHQKHFKYLVLSMLVDDRLEREDLLREDEVPASLVGYDHALPADADRAIEERFLPFVARRHPELLPLAEYWLAADIERAARDGDGAYADAALPVEATG
jgi:hypothetical protein